MAASLLVTRYSSPQTEHKGCPGFGTKTVGNKVGLAVGDLVGASVGGAVGALVGAIVGMSCPVTSTKEHAASERLEKVLIFNSSRRARRLESGSRVRSTDNKRSALKIYALPDILNAIQTAHLLGVGADPSCCTLESSS